MNGWSTHDSGTFAKSKSRVRPRTFPFVLPRLARRAGRPWSLSIQFLTTRANGPPGQQLENGTPCTRDTHTSTALGEADNCVISTTFEELRAALGLIDADEADVLGVCRLRVAVEDLPTSSGGDITQGVGRKGILEKL